MHVDKYGLPVQADGDANDQLQRASMLVMAAVFGSAHVTMAIDKVMVDSTIAIATEGHSLQPKPGLWVRFTGGETNNVSADQIISAIAAHLAGDSTRAVWATFARCLARFGFAQNYKDGLNESSRIKVPDFMLLRALPLFARAHWSLYPLTLGADLALLAASIASVGPVWRDGKGFSARSADDVDDNVLILTLLACSARMPTPLSRLACAIYANWRPWNYGCAEEAPYVDHGYAFANERHPVVGALLWYHRGDSGGNPEIAEAIIPAVKEYILRKDSVLR